MGTLTEAIKAAASFYHTKEAVILRDKAGQYYVAGRTIYDDYGYHYINCTTKSVVYGHYGYHSVADVVISCSRDKDATEVWYGEKVSKADIANEAI